jgi:hypothetical protein
VAFFLFLVRMQVIGKMARMLPAMIPLYQVRLEEAS